MSQSPFGLRQPFAAINPCNCSIRIRRAFFTVLSRAQHYEGRWTLERKKVPCAPLSTSVLCRAVMKTDEMKYVVGRNIQRLREKSGKTKSDLSASIGMSRKFWDDVENGNKEASISSLERIAT